MRPLTAVIVAVLLMLSGTAWWILARQSASMSMAQSSMAPPVPGAAVEASRSAAPVLAAVLHPEPGMREVGPGWFMAVWVLMMIAMMFPFAAPMVVGYAAIMRPRQDGARLWLSVAAFTAGYLAVWTLVGTGALGLNLVLSMFLQHAMSPPFPQVTAGAVLIAAGLYQFTAWKRTCLTHCRSTLSFFLHKWRPGPWGALRMGSDHGGYCVGCCWGLMSVLFAVGLMNLAWMALLSVVIGLEKLSPQGVLATRVIGATLMLAGGFLTAAPFLRIT